VLLQAYIGGIGFFVGPIIGAILLTLLSTVVSSATDLWLLYAGLIFVGTALFVPQGMTGLVMMHAPAFRTGRAGGLIGPYVLAALPVAALLLGLIGLLETVNFNHRAGVGDTSMRLFYLTFDTQSLTTWLSFAALVIVGALGVRMTRPLVQAAWARANAPLAGALDTTIGLKAQGPNALSEQAAE
jgi:branched-chain amino acid transport system permease protein